MGCNCSKKNIFKRAWKSSSNKTTKPSATRVKNNNNPNTSNLSRKLLS